jgi:release factor glutamine methyltransferase
MTILLSLKKKDIAELAKENNVSERDVFLLLSDILRESFSTVFFMRTIDLTDYEFFKLVDYVSRLRNKEPISKIIKKKEFYGIEFKTSEHTLDPRSETELIIDLFQKHFQDRSEGLKILDLGAGTGCIGLSLLSIYKNYFVEFVDISQQALDVAIENARNLSLIERCSFTKSDWFSEISEKYDAIVSNPPYISSCCELSKSTLYDPEIALFAGVEGLDCHVAILSEADKFMKPLGKLFLEIGFDQLEKVLKIKTSLKLIEIAKDLQGTDRVIVFSCST